VRKSNNPMLILAGLGNPEPTHRLNRHNIGFIAVDEIIRRYAFSGGKMKFKGWLYDGMIGTEKAMVIKPQTYMNKSGECLAAACQFYKVSPENLLVFYDELDLPQGKIKVKQGGGNAGHNGLRSIDAHLGENYWRIRIGIGHPGRKDLVHSYVLSNFTTNEQDSLASLIKDIAEHITVLMSGDANGFMNKLSQTKKLLSKPLSTD